MLLAEDLVQTEALLWSLEVGEGEGETQTLVCEWLSLHRVEPVKG